MTYFEEQLYQIRETAFPDEQLIRQMVLARNFMAENYSERISLEAIAGAAHLSKFHFNRLFKRIFGQTPFQFLTGLRIEKAKLLLRQGQPVKEVCFAVGFESIGNFTSLFKRMTGKRPSSFFRKPTLEMANTAAVPLKYYPIAFMAKK